MIMMTIIKKTIDGRISVDSKSIALGLTGGGEVKV